MQVADFVSGHIEQAAQIAMQNYEEARGHVPALPPVDAIPDLTPLAKNGYRRVLPVMPFVCTPTTRRCVKGFFNTALDFGALTQYVR